MTTDPVCGMRIVKNQAAGMSTQKGEDYYFCSLSCKEKFDKQPAQFIPKNQAAKRPNADATL
jgi:P-type Cu+ transporter